LQSSSKHEICFKNVKTWNVKCRIVVYNVNRVIYD